MPVPLYLALRDLRHGWIAAACFIAALVGLLAPMLILLALKTGAIDRMVDRLVEDPSNRELVAVGAGQHGPEFFRWLSARPEVGFALPATRSINALADAVTAEAGPRRSLARSVPLIVSAAGDPLAGEPPPAPGQVWLSAPLAQSLGAGVGARLTLHIGRRIDGTDETARARLEVAGIVPAERHGRPALFLSLTDMLAVERFRDDPTVTAADWLDPAPPPASYASFRLYARSLAELAPLAEALAARGVEVRPRAENAALLLRFRQAADGLYLGIALLGGAGFWAAMSANLRGMVERQRISLSLLGMLGLPPAGRAAIPLIQSLLLVGAGFLLSLALVGPAVLLINHAFRDTAAGVVAQLSTGQLAAAGALVAATAASASLWAMVAATRISAEEVLRHG